MNFELDSIISKLKEARSNDMPETLRNIFTEAKDDLIKNHDHQNLCSLITFCLVNIKLLRPEILVAAEDAIKIATEEGKKDMIALYYLIAGKASEYCYGYDNDFPHKTPEDYYQLALSDPIYLASISMDDIDWLDKGEDSVIFGNDLLSFIGIECGHYDVLYEYYKDTDNRSAACYSRIQMIIKEYCEDEEKYEKLADIIKEYDDIPVVCVAVEYICDHNLFPKSHNTGIDAENEYAEFKYSFIKKFVERFSDDKHIIELESLLKEMERPVYETSTFNQTIGPDQSFSIPTKIKNIKSLTLSIYPTDLTGRNVDHYNEKKMKAHASPKPIFRKVYDYTEECPYIFKETLLEVDGLPLGIYMIELKSNYGDSTVDILHVSNIMSITEFLPNFNLRIVVVNNVTGHPIPYAKIDIMKYWGKILKKTLSCDENGEIIFDYNKYSNIEDGIFPYTDDDKYGCVQQLWAGYQYSYEHEGFHEYNEIITDRSIYRPGQTIHAAFISYSVNCEKKVKSIQKEFDVQLSKQYGKSIAQAAISTDKFGVANYDFVIPEDVETGRYYITCDKNQKSIQIEEYKRPTFEVKLEDYKGEYKVGDTITVKGIATSYTGVPISDAVVNYRIKRRAAWWWHFMNPYWEIGGTYGRYGERNYHVGIAETNSEGKFEIEVPMLLTDIFMKNDITRPLFMDIITEADVVDTTGEMQSASTVLPLSNREYYMSIQMEEKFEASETKSFVISIKNASGKDLDKEIDFWLDDSPKITKSISNKSIILSKTETGRHILHAKYEDEEVSHDFLVFDKNADCVPAEMDLWSYQSGDVFPKNGDDIIIQIGCSKKDTYILYNIFSGKTLLECGTEYSKTGMINRHFSYKREYGNAILISYAWVKDMKMRTKNFTITKPIPKHELRLSWSSFRDRVSPGTQEVWTLSVRDSDGRNVSANVIATMYDKALEKIAPNSWDNFGPKLKWNIPDTDWCYNEMRNISLEFARDSNSVRIPYRFNAFKSFVINMLTGKYLNPVRFSIAKEILDFGFEEKRCLEEECCIARCYDDGMNRSQQRFARSPEPMEHLRSNMSETAFFMPMLRTDDYGNVKIEFTLPDSLTTWKFKAFAHTKEMYCSLFEDETIARKTVMVQPNLPRFVRVGDETTITTTVINTSEDMISGRVVLELLNAADEKLIYSDSKPLELDGNKSCAVSFLFTPDEEIEDYICKVYAVGNNFSDGEQHSIPVLPDKTEVIVSYIISQDREGTEEINTGVLLPEGCSRRHLLLQYTNNPIWLAIKALPAMTDYESDNAISIAVSLYCNLLTAHLQKNVMKYGTIEMPDTITLEKTTKKLVNKLRKLQGYGGGFRWYKDMPESLYMTTEILMHLCRLQKFTGDDFNKIGEIVGKAFKFCDGEMVSWVKELRKREEKGEKVYMPTFTLLQHMYNCAISGRELSNKAKDSYEFLMQLLKKDIHEQTMREKAMSAVILEYAGEHEKAMAYAESLRQYTKLNPERGRTFDTPRATFSWYSYKIPTHVSGMEALFLLCPEDKTTLREMQKWLLNEKRTQKWDTPIDCVNAVHALLLNADEYISDNCISKFYADGEKMTVNIKGNEGYTESEIPATTKSLTIEKTSKGLSWGAVFAQFLQPISDVESSGSGMTIEREILSDKEELHVGDRITVRLTYTCERNFDMVTVIDSKAACMEPVHQLSWNDSFKNVSPRDKEVRYSYYGLGQGTHAIETEYYLDRPGTYELGVATIQCTYAPEFRAICKSQKINVLK